MHLHRVSLDCGKHKCINANQKANEIGVLFFEIGDDKDVLSNATELTQSRRNLRSDDDKISTYFSNVLMMIQVIIPVI